MARVDTLPHFLTDVADAIREKKGTEETIKASDFDTEIENLPSGADLSEYFDDETASNISALIKKIPAFSLKSSATDMKGILGNLSEVLEVEKISGGSGLTKTNSAFSSKKLQKVDLSGITSQSITDMSSMFNGCNALTTVNFGNFYTGNVTTMNSMFMVCRSLTTLDLSSFTSDSLTNIYNMFGNCTSLQHLDMRNFVFSTQANNPFGTSSSNGVPSGCEIIVKDNTEKAWVLSMRSDFTNVKTVAEYEA